MKNFKALIYSILFKPHKGVKKYTFPSELTKEKIGINVRLMRENLGIKRKKLCQDIRIQRRQLLDIELSRSNYTIDTYLKVINYLSSI